MKVGVFAALASPYAGPEVIQALGRTADERGIHSIWVPEHVVLFEDYASQYPYSPDGKVPAPPAARNESIVNGSSIPASGGAGTLPSGEYGYCEA